MKTARKETQKNVLTSDINQSLRELVRLSKQLVEFADQETQCLVTNDHLRFAYTQRDKENLAERYTQASEEFRSRIDEFRNADKSILIQLDRLQAELKEKTESNNLLIGQIKKRAAANTQSTLFTVQELGQKVFFPEETAQNDERVAK